MTTQPIDVDAAKKRWPMLAVVSLAQLVMALNWFNISPALPNIAERLGFGVEGQGAAVSAFVLAFALLHIPGGMLGARIGIRKTLILGSVVEAVGTALAGLAPNLTTLLVARIVAGAGASVITVVAIGAMSAWFYKREITLAMSMITGVAFTGGIALSFYVWTYVQQSSGWTTSALLAAALQLVVAAIIFATFRTPPGYRGLDGASRLDLSAIWAACRNRHVLIYGIAFMGTYGVYITVSQLLVPYAISERGLDASAASLLGGTIALVGIPVSLLGGWFADRTGRVRAIIGWGTAITAASAFLIPLGATTTLWAGGLGVTVFLLLAFPAWTAVPAQVARVPLDMVASASGVMFMLSGIGGFVMPILYGAIAGSAGPTIAWITIAVITAAFGLLGILGGNTTQDTADGLDRGLVETERST